MHLKLYSWTICAALLYRVLYSIFDVLCDHCNNECITAILVVVVVAAALVAVVVVVVMVVGYA